jgi:hypothetical protein
MKSETGTGGPTEPTSPPTSAPTAAPANTGGGAVAPLAHRFFSPW